MEFSNRTNQQLAAQAVRPNSGGKRSKGKLLRALTVFGLFCVAVLILAMAVLFATSDNKNEGGLVDKNKYQAVFLNGGQVYFGKIRDLNNKFVVIEDIYYLRINETANNQEGNNQNRQQASQDISLAKLGCELHRPEDRMVINREHLSFWENLKDDGQVVKAIDQFIRQNPDGQRCAEPQTNN